MYILQRQKVCMHYKTYNIMSYIMLTLRWPERACDEVCTRFTQIQLAVHACVVRAKRAQLHRKSDTTQLVEWGRVIPHSLQNGEE